MLIADIQTGGSSPRTWGTPTMPYHERITIRFIPTYMGNARTAGISSWSIAVHPHVHGERISRPALCGIICGSSPRTWGTPPLHTPALSGVRFIPTYMGNALFRIPRFRNTTVHPHVHGERVIGADDRYPVNGSSPRTWGTPESCRTPGSYIRFIPTYMGNA